MTVSQEIEELIADARLSAHLATSVDDHPHVAPVWYVYEDETLAVLTGGKKLRNVRRNPRVAVSIEQYDQDGVDWGVQLLGTARIVDDDDRIRDVGERLDEKYAGPYGTDGGREDEGENWGLVEIDIGSASIQQY